MQTFDPQAATNAMIDGLGPEALALARDYTLGGHWLILAGLAVSALITWIIVKSGLLGGLNARLAARHPALRIYTVALVFLLVSTLLSLPYDLYESWWREVQYGRTSQPLGDFLAQSAIAALISAVIGALLLLGIYRMLKRTGKWWWAWSSGLVAAGLVVFLLLSPTFIEPLFNDYQPVPEGEVKGALTGMAEEAGIPADRIFVFDGSRQSNNFTANVSGLGPAARIAISDVALGEASLDEVKAVTGHEIGHYVLGHVWRTVIILSVLAMAVFWLTARLYPWFAARFGTNADIADVRGLPVLVFVFSLLGVVATPLTNSLTRISESEADVYSLENVGLPDALAGALVKTAEYRYPRPAALEEMLFYTHPSVERRVRRAMEFKAQALAGNP